MKDKNLKILVITPVKHINGLEKILSDIGECYFLEDPTKEEVKRIISEFNVIYTNPNKSKVFLGKELLKESKKLKDSIFT